jgi:comEA protein
MKYFFPKGLAFLLAIAFALLPALQLQAGIGAGTAAVTDKVNINTATQAELDKLPRIGPKIAQRIIDYRKEHGPFKRVEDLMKVKGIGEKTFARLRELITVGLETQNK